MATSASSSSSGEVDVGSVAIPPPEVFYVIVGRGPGGVMNCTTLLGSDDGLARVDGRKILQIGFKNPWPMYLEHGMGQPGYLLTLPGFAEQPNKIGTEVDGGLNSREFGAAINKQLRKLVDDHGVVIKPGWILWIQKKGATTALPAEPGPDKPGYEAEGDAGAVMLAALKEAVTAANLRNDWPEAHAEYRLFLATGAVEDTPTIEVIYASHIDFCTGPGRPQIVGKGDARDMGKTPPWLAPEAWTAELRNRPVLNGVDAILRNVTFDTNDRICVTAGGGVGLNCAEKSQKAGCWLDWFARGLLHGTFENPRNQTFLANTAGERLKIGDLTPALNDAKTTLAVGAARSATYADDTDPIPVDKRKTAAQKKAAAVKKAIDTELAKIELRPTVIKLRHGRNCSLERVDAPDTNAVVALKGGTAALLDHNRVETTLDDGKWGCAPAYLTARFGTDDKKWPSKNYDRLIIPNGQQPNQLGQPWFYKEIGTLTALVGNGRMVGLQNANGRVRLLGAAAQVYDKFAVGNYDKTGTAPRDKMWAYRLQLPISTVPDGMILSGVNIATANGYFAGKPNKNVNTMTEAELNAALPDDATLVERIMATRNAANGFGDFARLRKFVNVPDEILPATDKDRIEAKIEYGYPPV